VNDAKITDVVLAVLANNHELGLPQLLVVWDLVVVSLTLTNFVDALGAINADLKVFEFLGINGLETHV